MRPHRASCAVRGSGPRGPARLTLALDLDRAHDGLDTTVPGATVRLVAGEHPVTPSEIENGPRVGVSGPGGGPEYPWRYHLRHPTVSVYRAAVRRRAGTPGKLDPTIPRAGAADRAKG